MFQGLRRFFSSPYLAPMTEPVKNVAKFTAAPLRGFGEAFRNSLEGEYTGWPLRFFDEATIDDDHTGLITVGGAFLTGLGGLFGGGIIGATAASTMAGAIAAGIGGAVAGPFVGAAVVGFGALVVGSVIGIVPGVIAGTGKMLKHIFSKKDAPETAAPANDDAVATPEPVRTVLRGPRTAQEMLQSLSTLQTEERKAFEAAMMEHLRPAFEAAAAVVMPKDDASAFANKDKTPAFAGGGAAFGKIGKLAV